MYTVQLPEDGIWVPKHVGVFICVIYIVSWSAFVGKYIDCRNMNGISNIQFIDLQVTSFGFSVKPSSDLFIIKSHVKTYICMWD